MVEGIFLMITKKQWEKIKEFNEIARLQIADILYLPILHDVSPYVYIVYNCDNEVIYVGQSINIDSRIANHIENTAWWNEVTIVIIAEVEEPVRLDDYERYYIQKYNPKYNKQRYAPRCSEFKELNFHFYYSQAPRKLLRESEKLSEEIKNNMCFTETE